MSGVEEQNEPYRIAVCNIIDANGEIVKCKEEPVRVHIEIANPEELEKKSLVFVEWWD